MALRLAALALLAGPHALAADIDYKDVPLADLGVKPVAEKKDDKTGFVVGGKNPTGLVKGLTHLAGRPVADLEADMRPGAKVEVGSDGGFLGKDESLLDVLAADNKYVVDELGLTHQALARHLRVLVAVAERRAREKTDGPFTYHGRPFAVEVAYSRGEQLSPFKDGTRTNADARITNVATGRKIAFSPLAADMAERYGFWEGTGTPYRLAPKDVVAALDFLTADKKDEKIDPAKLVGKWAVEGLPDTALLEFSKDGKVAIKLFQNLAGTYTVDGNKLTLKLKVGGGEEEMALTVVKLTDAALVTKDKDGKEEKFERVKDKK